MVNCAWSILYGTTWKFIERAMPMLMTNDFNAGSCVLGLLQTAAAVFVVSASLGVGANGFNGAVREPDKARSGSAIGSANSRFAFVPTDLQLRLVARSKTSDTLVRRPTSNAVVGNAAAEVGEPSISKPLVPGA